MSIDGGPLVQPSSPASSTSSFFYFIRLGIPGFSVDYGAATSDVPLVVHGQGLVSVIHGPDVADSCVRPREKRGAVRGTTGE